MGNAPCLGGMFAISWRALSVNNACRANLDWDHGPSQPPQVAESPPSFEVVSIKANHSGERILKMFHLGRGGRFTATNCSLGILIPYAYNVFQFQISGVPGWVRSDG